MEVDNISVPASTANPNEAGWTEPTPYNYSAFQMPAAGAEYVESGVQWDGLAKRYEWNEEFGEVAPRVPELEEQLYGTENAPRAGIDFTKVLEVQVEDLSEAPVASIWEFSKMQLHQVMRENIELCRFEKPTPIQAYIIPAMLAGRDVIATAQTGSGKTGAYLIPIINRLMGKAKKLAGRQPFVKIGAVVRDRYIAEPLVLVVVPTRELALQVFRDASRLCYRSMLRPCVAYGGMPVREQEDDLTKRCDILIATPGRLCDFLQRPHILNLSRCRFTVIDEADELLEDDWEPQIKEIMAGRHDDHIFAMFSATFPKSLKELAANYMASDYIHLAVGRVGSTTPSVKQRVEWVDQDRKLEALRDLLISFPGSRTIIFVNSVRTCEMVDDYLYQLKFPVTSIHSGRNQREREDALRACRLGNCPILVASGVLARGIDIKDVLHVVNYDLPDVQHGGILEYVHRIGRTARIGHLGMSTSFYNSRDEGLAPNLVKILLETKSEVPEFLKEFEPADGVLRFNEEEAEVEAEQQEEAESMAVEQPAGADDW